jgi:ketosteroid isomerase-like protein
MAKGFRDWLGAWENLRMEPQEYRVLDDERVLVLVRYIGHGRTSGLDLEQLPTTPATLFQLRDGKVVKIVSYWDRDRALADLGLTRKADTT